MDSRLTRAISSPKIQQHASELVKLALRALDDLRQLDESLYERFLETRGTPEDPDAATQRMRKLWEDTFRGLRELLAYTKTALGERKKKPDAPVSDDIDFGDFDAPVNDATALDLDLGSADFGDLLDGLGDDGSDKSEADRWNVVLDKLESIEYGLSSQLDDATERFAVAIGAGEMNQVLGLLDDTQSSTSEGVHAVVSAIYAELLPDTNPATVVPGYLTSLGRALLVRRGLADLQGKLTLNDVLQDPARAAEHEAALAGLRQQMRVFVSSVVCRAMRAADRWQMVEFERELSEQPLSVARLTAEGLVKYIDSLATINQREVLVLHDRRTLDEMRESLSTARQLLDLSPQTANEMMDRAYQAAQRLRGRHPATDALIVQLERYAPTSSNPEEAAKFLERLEAVLAASG